MVEFDVIQDGHKDHKTLTLQEVTAIQKALLSKNLEEIDNLRCNSKEKNQQEEIALQIKSDGEKAKEEVQNATKKLVKILLDQEKQLLNEIQRSVAKADRNLRVIRHIPATQEYIRNILEKGLVSEMVDIQQSSNKCTYNPFKRGSLELVFDPNKELSQQVNAGLGKVRLSCKSDPMLSTIQMSGGPAGELNDEPTDDVDHSVQIRSEDDVKVEGRKMRSGGKIEVEFIPQVAGQLTAQVQVNAGNAVSNSPLVMDVKPQHMEEIAGDSKLKSALNTGSRKFRGIAVNKTNSRIAVADDRPSCVRVFNMDGDLLLTYGSKGSGQGQLRRPEGLAFLNETDLVIVDWGNERICIVNTITGTLVKTFGCRGNDNGQFSNPCGVHVDDDCNIVVTDRGNHRVQVFTKNGEYLYQFSLSNQGGFSPWCTVTHNGLFYVSNDSNKVIDVIEMKDNSPTRISTIGGNCHAAGQLQDPWGLAIDNNHNLLVYITVVPCLGAWRLGRESKRREVRYQFA
ncbi:hypothetical protein QZH41_006983 [Actinostola sp. cb2023]|nr:hypothetical protein QZH41_006983 [Actinostola sp. cb2023]